MAFKARRKNLVHRFTVKAEPKAIFPLLCPVREYDWIPFWKCRLIHSTSGRAEKDCVFRTFFLHRGRETWTCYLYEPNECIGYLHIGGGRVTRVEVSLTPEDQSTQITWSSTLTGLSWRGNRYIEKMSQPAYEGEIGALGAMLDQYVTTGVCMPKNEAKALFKKTRKQ